MCAVKDVDKALGVSEAAKKVDAQYGISEQAKKTGKQIAEHKVPHACNPLDCLFLAPTGQVTRWWRA
jgi:hypothetical protein